MQYQSYLVLGGINMTRNAEIENELILRESFEAVKYILGGVELHDLQCIDIMKMLYQERCIVLYDTGTGKTLLSSAFMKLLKREDSTRKFIMFVKKDQLIQTPRKIRDTGGLVVNESAADSKSINSIIQLGLQNTDVLMLTHNCLENEKIMNELFAIKHLFCGVIIDEAHELNNFANAHSALILQALCKAFQYCIALTATPITTEPKQLAHLAHIVNPERYKDYRRLTKDLANKVFDIREDPLFFINRNGEDFGGIRNYKGSIHWVPAMPHQKENKRGHELLMLCKGPGAYNQANELTKLLKLYKMQNRRGLVYVNQHEVREWILPFLDTAKINYACINGLTNALDREEIMRKFNEEKSVDVVITSVTTAIDLDCDYVIFYEFTVLVKQMIGRAHRGLGNKNLSIIFMLTDDTNEVDYFLENIIEKSLMVRDLVHKDFSEIEDVNDDVRQRIME